MCVPCGSVCAARCEGHRRVICCALLNIKGESLEIGGVSVSTGTKNHFQFVLYFQLHLSYVSSATNIIPTNDRAVSSKHSPPDILINLFQISMSR
jgi:hypothetical protein